MPTGRFEGQVAVITGGATGLGEGIANRLGAEGATVALFDRAAENLKRTTDRLRAAGIRATAYAVDITDESAVQQAFTQVDQELGPTDIMVNSAGIVGPTSTKILDYPVTDFESVCKVNLVGSFIMTKAALARMAPRNYGRILLIASIAGKEGNPGMSGYSSSKSGVIGLLKGVAKEYAQANITINGLAPAVVMTDLVRGVAPDQVAYMTAKIPMQRLGTIEEVAAMVAFIVSREASFTTGFVFDLSGGRATY